MGKAPTTTTLFPYQKYCSLPKIFMMPLLRCVAELFQAYKQSRSEHVILHGITNRAGCLLLPPLSTHPQHMCCVLKIFLTLYVLSHHPPSPLLARRLARCILSEQETWESKPKCRAGFRTTCPSPPWSSPPRAHGFPFSINQLSCTSSFPYSCRLWMEVGRAAKAERGLQCLNH